MNLIMLIYVFLCAIICTTSASTLTAPPQTAVVVGFENVYDLSLLANTLSDQGIDSVLIVPSMMAASDIYESLIEVEVIKLNFTIPVKAKKEEIALKACETLLGSEKILKRIREIQPTFTIFPALRHDACLLPWTRSIESIPIIHTVGPEDEYYAIDKSRTAMPIQTAGILDRFWTNIRQKAIVTHADTSYVPSALNLVKEYLPEIEEQPLDKWYNDIELVLWGGDPILRSEFATLTHRLVEVGCHHCRGVQPLPPTLQKELVDYKLGTIVVTLDPEFTDLIEKLAQRLPQGRQGQAIAWKSKNVKFINKPDNVFVHAKVDRQDLIGYGRTRVLLAHCTDTQFLEAAFHGTAFICFPRNHEEKKNALRAVQLGFSVTLNDDYSVDTVHKYVEEIHQTASYREAARSVSLAIRDRPMPVSDRLIYWLTFIARNKDSLVKFSPIHSDIYVKTLGEDLNFIYGLFFGAAFGALFATTTALTWYYQKKGSKLSGKMKSKKYNR